MFDEYSLKYGKNSKLPARKFSYNLRLSILRDTLKDNDCNVVLDIGSASGDYAMDLKKLGFEVICMDINLEYLRIARSKDKDVAAVTADASILPFKSMSFDAIIILNALRYFHDPSTSLRECNRVLKSGGHLILIDHNKFCLDAFMVRHEGMRYFSLRELEKLLDENGFKISNEEILFIPPPFVRGYLLNLALIMGARLKGILKRIYPEFFVHAVKR